MIELDVNGRNQLVIIVDTDHRTTVSMSQEEGLELHRQLTQHYGKFEMMARPRASSKGFWATLLGR